MKQDARVVVIGGGVVGCSVLYHLTSLGWTDVMLLERAELTAGSTWHAAGGMHTFNGDASVAGLQDYTIKLYPRIEAESGESCGIHRTGCLYLAVTQAEVEFLEFERSKARTLNLALDFIELAEAQRLNPLLEIEHYRAAMFDPNDGYIDPSGVTNAFARAARNRGAEIHRHTLVTQVRRRASGDWEIETPRGSIRAEYVVNAAGLWAREVGRLMGYGLPIVPMEHQYVVTNEVPELQGRASEIPALVDFNGAVYLRQERAGLLVGTYEQDCRHWAIGGTPADFGMELLPPDLERIAPALESMSERMPALAQAGIKRVVNGGMVFAPDGNPVIGPIPGQPTAFVAAGVMAGFSQGGGVGLALAHWIVDGEPGMDVFAMDVARFGDATTPAYVRAKTRENYQRRFVLPYPNEELQAGRPLLTTPVHGELAGDGAVFGAAAGWEVPLWFAGDKTSAREPPSFRRTAAFGSIAEECRAVRERAGLFDTSSYSKIEVSGAGAAQFLDTVVANQLPAPGRINLCPLLTPRGRILGDVTVSRLAPDRLLLLGSPFAESVYLRWLMSRPRDAEVRIESKTAQLCGFSLTGPMAREVLGRVCDTDVSTDALSFLSVREVTVGLAPVTLMRLSFTGELGYELYMAPQYQRHVYEALRSSGASVGLRLFGVRALTSLRLEKGYGSWGREYTQDCTPAEAGLGHLVRTTKGAFVGREAFLEQQRTPPQRRLRLLAIDANDPDPNGGEPVVSRGKPVGRLTSAAYGFTVGFALGLAYLPLESEESLEVDVFGGRVTARVLPAPPIDPAGKRLRS
jgi:dimethylglycine dehydrogenase